MMKIVVWKINLIIPIKRSQKYFKLMLIICLKRLTI
jgi:hypothetical protein